MKILRWLLAGFLLFQLPFVYSVCQTYLLHRYLNQLPRLDPLPVPFQDIRGSLHIHSAAGGHSLGTYPEIVEAARQASYRYLFLTEHPKEYPLFARLQVPDLVLVYGLEEDLGEAGRVLRSEDSRVYFLSDFREEQIPPEATGLEVYNMHENAEQANRWWNWVTFFYHQPFYPELFYFQIWELRWERLAAWDTLLQQRKLTAVAGNDAHQNVGIVLQTTAGQRLFSLMLDPYLRSFRFLTNHLLLPLQVEVSERTVLEALREGSSYIAFEQIADPTGFSFHALVSGEVHPMGSRVPTGSRLVFQAPLPSRFRVIRSGVVLRELEGRHFQLEADLAGAYRVEVYPLDPPGLLKDKPWILSNPILVR